MGPDDVLKIAVLNPKGGCGKTTLVTNLAAMYAARGWAPTIYDFDAQGYSTRWLAQRPASRPVIRGVVAHQPVEEQPAISTDSRVALLDLPAAVPQNELHEYTYVADNVLIPVMPSPMDVFAATRLVAELLLDMQLDRREQKLAVVANRVRKNTRSFMMLMRFLTSLKIPLIATLRDSQNYVHAATAGIGVCELPAYKARADLGQLTEVLNWLDRRQEARQRDGEIELEFRSLVQDNEPDYIVS